MLSLSSLDISEQTRAWQVKQLSSLERVAVPSPGVVFLVVVSCAEANALDYVYVVDLFFCITANCCVSYLD